jgi:hypothetical protein
VRRRVAPHGMAEGTATLAQRRETKRPADLSCTAEAAGYTHAQYDTAAGWVVWARRVLLKMPRRKCGRGLGGRAADRPWLRGPFPTARPPRPSRRPHLLTTTCRTDGAQIQHAAGTESHAPHGIPAGTVSHVQHGITRAARNPTHRTASQPARFLSMVYSMVSHVQHGIPPGRVGRAPVTRSHSPGLTCPRCTSPWYAVVYPIKNPAPAADAHISAQLFTPHCPALRCNKLASLALPS